MSNREFSRIDIQVQWVDSDGMAEMGRCAFSTEAPPEEIDVPTCLAFDVARALVSVGLPRPVVVAAQIVRDVICKEGHTDREEARILEARLVEAARAYLKYWFEMDRRREEEKKRIDRPDAGV